jgi:enterochelin esterase-like enzyme
MERRCCNTLAQAHVPKGELIRDALIDSKSLGYQVTYSVYLPYNYKQHGPLAVAYVTDGYEYHAPAVGQHDYTTLDNLIHTGNKISQPVIADVC